MMRLESIQAFLTTVEKGSLTKAAESLYITQPALSHQITELETELGESLLERKRGMRSVKLTPAGRAFVPMAEKWLSLWQETTYALTLGKRNTFSITASISLGYYSLGPLYASLPEILKDCDIHLSMGSSSEMYQMIDEGKADVAILCFPVLSSSLISVPVAREKFVMVCSPDSDYPDCVRVSDLDCRNEVYLTWCTECMLWHDNVFGVQRQPMVSLDSVLLIKNFLKHPKMWAILPLSLAISFGDKVRICQLDKPPADRTVYVISKRPAKQPYYDILMEELKNLLTASEGFTII